jgi:hypothetical protein
MTIAETQRQLEAMLSDPADVHVTAFAAACLRAVDAPNLAGQLADWAERGRYQQIVDAARQTLATSPAAGLVVCEEDKRALASHRVALGAATNGDGWSLFARAVAQAVYDVRGNDFWSYFSDWTEPRRLDDGDPVPVPTRVRLDEIYPRPHLRCCPAPDRLLGPYGLCPGGYRGLPALRLLDRPLGCPVEVYLDPSLAESVCPLAASTDAAGKITFIIPTTDLRSGFDVTSVSDENGVPGFGPIRAKDLAALQRTIVDAVKQSASTSALVMVPEFATAPEVDDELDLMHNKTGIGKIEVLVGGSAWRAPEDGATLGRNRATTWPRGRGAHHHDKYSWFSSKEGQENIQRGFPRIAIMAGPRTSYTVLICRDSLEPHVPELLQDLRLRLVLIPSCNPDVGPYMGRAVSLAELGGATVIVANLPPNPAPLLEYGLVVRPARPMQEGRSAQPETLVISGLYAPRFQVDVRQPEAFAIDRTVRRS